METRWLRIVLAILTLMTLMRSTSWAQGAHVSTGTSKSSALCQVSRKAKLAMDQRDDLRMNCLKQKKNEIGVSQCLTIANSMEYSTNAEEARSVCLYDLRHQLNAKECLTISKAMEYADSGDEARWECIRRFNKSISEKECKVFAKHMAYPANAQRAQQYCASELQ